MIPRNKTHYKEHIAKYSEDKNLKDKLEEIKSRPSFIKKQRAALIKKYGLSKEINYWLEIIDKYAYFHDLRKEMQVSNEGGITCHAAIISRELKIPCVVGTKIATQVLKDGDMVEVDADNGWVKIL